MRSLPRPPDAPVTRNTYSEGKSTDQEKNIDAYAHLSTLVRQVLLS